MAFLDFKKGHHCHGATGATVQYIMAHIHNITRDVRDNSYLQKLDVTSRKIRQGKKKKRKI